MLHYAAEMEIIGTSTYQRLLESVADRIEPVVSLSKPFIDGLEDIPSDGRLATMDQTADHAADRRPERDDAPDARHRPTMIPRPQRTYLRFGAPIDTARPKGTVAAKWIATVRERVKAALEAELADLLQIRETDPYRQLAPWARGAAVSP